MRIGKTLKPGRPGTARWVERYGDRLVAMRYRYDPARSMRYTTVELVVDSCPWRSGTGFASTDGDRDLVPETVFVRVSYLEPDLRARVKAAGGRWDPTRKAWEIRFAEVARLHIRDRIQFVTDPLDAPRPGPPKETT